METNNENKDLIGELIEIVGTQIKSMTPGSKEHSEAVSDLATLCKIRDQEIESERALRTNSDADIFRERELQLKAAQIAGESRREWIRTASTVATGVMSLVLGFGLAYKGFKLEYIDDGMIRGKTLQTLLPRMNPFKVR